MVSGKGLINDVYTYPLTLFSTDLLITENYNSNTPSSSDRRILSPPILPNPIFIKVLCEFSPIKLAAYSQT